MKGDMYLACSSDGKILKRAEYGGAVTSLLKFALESKTVDGVLSVTKRNGNRFDGVPTLITDPDKIINMAGTLHCTSPNIASFLKEYLDGAFSMKIALTCKPCDARAIIELAKRDQINMENLILIGLNCTGTFSPVVAREMFQEEFKVDPDDVTAEDIENGKLIIKLKDGAQKEKDLAELEKKALGRRENCRRCEINIPTMADIACGKWGINDKKATFIEVCSQKGSDFMEKAIEAEAIKVKKPDSTEVKTRKRKAEEAIELSKKWQQKDFAPFKNMAAEEKFDYWWGQFSQCIKCYGCRDACPICYCKGCILEADRGVVMPGEVPPNAMFPMIRIAHVMDSCLNCGQCQDACPAGIPLSRLIFMLNKELYGIFKYQPGLDITSRPPLRSITDQELTMPGVEVAF